MVSAWRMGFVRGKKKTYPECFSFIDIWHYSTNPLYWLLFTFQKYWYGLIMDFSIECHFYHCSLISRSLYIWHHMFVFVFCSNPNCYTLLTANVRHIDFAVCLRGCCVYQVLVAVICFYDVQDQGIQTECVLFFSYVCIWTVSAIRPMERV